MRSPTVLGARTTTHDDRRCDIARIVVETVALHPIGKDKNFVIILPLPCVNSRPIGARSLPFHVDRGANSRPVAVISRQIGVVGVVGVVGAPPLGVVHEHTPVSIPVFMNTKIANSNFH